MKPRIIYQDDAVIVAYKPAGLATQTARVGQADMVSELKKELMLNRLEAGIQSSVGQNKGRQASVYLGVIHRLDQPVEGLLVFAKTPKAAAELSRQLSGGSLNKQYFAVVYPQPDGGKPYAKEAELVDYMFKDKNNCAQIVTEEIFAGRQSNYPEAKKAVLRYKRKETISLSATELALADIHIETGRFHQIRCQMAHNGMPLLGDAKYADEPVAKLSRELGIRSVALCAYKLGFQHPVTKKKMSFEIKPENKAFELFLENNFGCDCLY